MDEEQLSSVKKAVSLLIEALGHVEPLEETSARMGEAVSDLSALIEELHLVSIGA